MSRFEESGHARGIKRTVQQAIKRRVHVLRQKRGMTQRELAEELEMTQPRLSLLLNDRLELFSLECLVDVATKTGLTVRMQMTREYKQGRQSGVKRSLKHPAMNA